MRGSTEGGLKNQKKKVVNGEIVGVVCSRAVMPDALEGCEGD